MKTRNMHYMYMYIESKNEAVNIFLLMLIKMQTEMISRNFEKDNV